MDLKGIVIVGALVAILGTPVVVYGHCDGLDGPVVNAARAALDSREVAHALIWVAERDEAEVRTVFDKVLAVRALGGDAKQLADTYFFETVVRLHRASEGAPYTGLKPAGRDLGPVIPAADQAIAEASAEPLVRFLQDGVARHIREQLHAILDARDFPASDLAAGRRYVRAYVDFVHYLEALHEAVSRSPHGHFPDASHSDER